MPDDDKKKFNEDRIKAWKAQRQALAAEAAIKRREEAETERKDRAEAFKRQRLDEIKALEQEKKSLALEQLPNLDKINQTKQIILLEQQQRKRLFLKKMAYLLLGSLLLTLFSLLLSTPFYEAESVVTIKTNSLTNNKMAASILPTSVSPNVMQYIFAAREYILSREMMNRMEQGEGFVRYFKNKDIQVLSRPFLNKDDYSYYKQRVHVAIDIQEGLMRIKVQAINQADAKRFAKAFLVYAEHWVNALSNRMFDDRILDAQHSLDERKRNLQVARKRILQFQMAKRDLNPRETVAAIYKNLDDIAFKSKQTEREIAVYKRALISDSPVVDRLKTHLSVLRQQQNGINKRLIDKGQWSMNKILSSFERANLEKDVAEKEWEMALKTLEEVKLDVFNQRQYFLTIVPPVTSSLPVEPKPLKSFLLMVLVSYGLMSLSALAKTLLQLSAKT